MAGPFQEAQRRSNVLGTLPLGEPDSLAPTLEGVLPAVANISMRSRVQRPRNRFLDDPFFRRFFDLPEETPGSRQIESRRSGVIVDAERGYVLTKPRQAPWTKTL